MGFADNEIAEHLKVIEDTFWSRRRPPLHLRDKVREGQRFTDRTSEEFGKEQAERERQEELERFCAELAEGNAEARRKALDRLPPPTVRAYQAVFGRDPKGWPPA